MLPRSAGVLLHPTSLPGPFGIGDLGPEAYRWVETLAAMKQHWWQILPLGPTGYGDSPYQAYSAFAGNINLLSPELLHRDGLLPADVLHGHGFRADRVDYTAVTALKTQLVRQAWDAYTARPHELQLAFESYCAAEKSWLHDYASFRAIRSAFGDTPLMTWPTDVRQRNPVALVELEKQLHKEILIHKFGQFLFDRQWLALKTFANKKNVKIIGDAPIFVALDSSDVWANPGEFLLDDSGQPTALAGVPPDYFSEDGQFWGNPLYDWAAMECNRYAWWAARLRRQFAQVDLIRLDHFRGFAAAWHVPPTEKTAKNGTWIDGPRAKLFHALKAQLGELPIIAEDLGVITPDVTELRLQFGLPGMTVLQFMLGGPENLYWPHNYVANTVAYTGTHDNDTSLGWYQSLGDTDRQLLTRYIGHEMREPHLDLVHLAWASVAVLAIAPMQDLLGLDGAARMNVPGLADGNWGWRFEPRQFPGGLIERLAEMTRLYGRVTEPEA
jgi:4-alpha-glucanotransferase